VCCTDFRFMSRPSVKGIGKGNGVGRRFILLALVLIYDRRNAIASDHFWSGRQGDAFFVTSKFSLGGVTRPALGGRDQTHSWLSSFCCWYSRSQAPYREKSKSLPGRDFIVANGDWRRHISNKKEMRFEFFSCRTLVFRRVLSVAFYVVRSAR